MARIPEAELERLKAQISVERLVEASGIALKSAGKDLLGRCLFHEDREASLVVTPALRVYLSPLSGMASIAESVMARTLGAKPQLHVIEGGARDVREPLDKASQKAEKSVATL